MFGISMVRERFPNGLLDPDPVRPITIVQLIKADSNSDPRLHPRLPPSSGVRPLQPYRKCRRCGRPTEPSVCFHYMLLSLQPGRPCLAGVSILCPFCTRNSQVKQHNCCSNYLIQARRIGSDRIVSSSLRPCRFCRLFPDPATLSLRQSSPRAPKGAISYGTGIRVGF